MYARKAIAQADKGLRPEALYALVGLDPDHNDDESTMVSEDDYCALFETIAASDSKPPSFHIRTGASMRCDDLGAAGLAWKSAPTLRQAFHRIGRYARLLTRVQLFEIERGTQTTRLQHQRLSRSDRLGAKLSNEAAFVTITSLCREASGAAFCPTLVQLAHRPVGDVDLLERTLGCPVTFDQGHNAMVIANPALDRPNVLGDPAISKFFEAHIDAKLAETELEVPIDRRVRMEVARALSGGVPKISDIAGKMGMTSRTLQRRLGERALAYQALVDDARRELAERLLRTTDYPLQEIAFLTGFAEQSGFNRAFRRWAGQTPRSYRLASR
ncbi:MAG: AraC family transcriptional regulator ligand-binding domain-containing protein [Pseudomonadales bacterium]